MSALLFVVALAAPGCKRDAPHSHSARRGVFSGPPLVNLSFRSQTARVDLRRLPAEPVQGRALVRLARLWDAGGFSVPPTHLDFVGDDGFRPGSKPKCPEKLAGAMLQRGYIDPTSRDLVWDEDLKLPGCYRVWGVASIEGLE